MFYRPTMRINHEYAYNPDTCFRQKPRGRLLGLHSKTGPAESLPTCSPCPPHLLHSIKMFVSFVSRSDGGSVVTFKKSDKIRISDNEVGK